MDSENSEKRDLDCPDNTTCDTTFTKLLKSYKYDMRRANKETVAASAKTFPEDSEEFSNVDLLTGAEEAFSAFGITPIPYDNSTSSDKFWPNSDRDPFHLDDSEKTRTSLSKNEKIDEISSSQMSGNLFGPGTHIPSVRKSGDDHPRSIQPEFYYDRNKASSKSRIGRQDEINNEYDLRYKGKRLNHLDPNKYGNLTSLFSDRRQDHQLHLPNIQVARRSASAEDDSINSNAFLDTNILTPHHWPIDLDCTGPTTEPLRQLRDEQQRSSPKREQQLQQHRRQKSSPSKPEKGKDNNNYLTNLSTTNTASRARAKPSNTISALNSTVNDVPYGRVMSNYISSLDGQYAMANNSIPRQAPSPNQGQHQPNGIVGSNNNTLNNNNNGINGNVGNNPGLGTGSAIGTGSNGVTGAGVGAGMGFLNGLPSAGHQTDMNYLWSVVQQLSEVLADNRAQTAGIVRSVQHLQTRAVAEGISPTLGEVNGELLNASLLSASNGSMSNDNTSTSASSSNNLASTNSTFPPSSSSQQATSLTSASAPASSISATATAATSASAAEILSLQSLLTASERRATALESHTVDLRSLLNDYEAAMQLILDKLRTYAYNHTHALIALHAHYNGLLTTERNTNLDLRLEHQSWQAGLARVADYARVALREQADARLPYLRRIAALKGENRVLRSLAGWEVGPEGDGSESESEVDGEREFGRLGSVDGKDLEKEVARDR